jgi:aminoglycoside phosphotransferase (APT) family kinase protein
LVAELGLGRPEDIVSIQALAGGVSSDIAVVTLPDRKICVKGALPQLKVAAQWLAPMHRNATEYRWLSTVAAILPEAVPKLYGQSATLSAFAMEYLDPSQFKNWKASLLAGEVDSEAARAVARSLAKIHAHSATKTFPAASFQDKVSFHALRLEPYLEFTALKHPSIRDQLYQISLEFHAAQIALVHGDVSPKNIVVGAKGPVLLDAECAVMGDPAFDIAFCMNHFLLKAAHRPAQVSAYVGLVGHFWEAYQGGLNWESALRLEGRVARLLPALLLARVDGKSPAEYLNSDQQQLIRVLAIPFIKQSPQHLEPILTALLKILRS